MPESQVISLEERAKDEEKPFLEQSIHTSWETLRRQLSTHQVVTVRLPTTECALAAYFRKRETR